MNEFNSAWLRDYERRIKIKNSHSQLSTIVKKQNEGLPLVGVSKRKKQVIRSTERRIKITFTTYSMRPPDHDSGNFKYILDGIVKSGILHGDAWYQLKGEYISEKASSKDTERTEILITKLP